MVFGNTRQIVAPPVEAPATMEIDHKQEYHVRNLGTRSVTLFPSRAQVVREVRDVSLKPGANQITIIGLTPTLDEHSIKVEGTGSAIISDIAVELLPNRDIFQDFYPDSDDDDDDDDNDPDYDTEADDEDYKEKTKESDALKDVRKKIRSLRDEQKCALEILHSAENRLKILDSYGKLLTTDRNDRPTVNIAEGVETYRVEREKVFRDHMDGMTKERDLEKELSDIQKEENRLLRLVDKELIKANKVKAKAQKAKQKEKVNKWRKESELTKEKRRIRKEREAYWPKKVYVVKVSLEATSFTPMSSRRSSVSSDVVRVVPEKETEDVQDDANAATSCDLTLSYVTTCAFWSPNYDLALSTTANSGMLCFDARLTNQTSETWSNCKVVLSTSQTDFSGLSDTIPSLVPWHVRLAGHGGSGTHTDILYSREEKSRKAGLVSQQNFHTAQRPRWELFGLDQEQSSLFGASGAQAGTHRWGQPGLFGQPAPQNQGDSAFSGSSHHHPVTSAPKSGGGLFGNASAVTEADKSYSGGFGPNSNNRASGLFGGNHTSGGALFGTTNASTCQHDAENEEVTQDMDSTITEPAPELAFPESSFEEMGLTTTYDLPGLKCLVPSSTVSKQRVAHISFSKVVFSHTVVAKYKPAAYLKAKVRNGSKLTLLKGPAGLTLDGSFLGRTALPRCSPGDAFDLSLGVDPAIHVTYPKPDVKRSQSGMFSKEDSGLYTRSIRISNTRTGAKGKAARITVLDQVPVSQEERLRVDVLQPKGLVLDGPGVATGHSNKGPREDTSWGKAEATLRKRGELSWDVTVNAGHAARLMLEYQCVFPTGDHVVTA